MNIPVKNVFRLTISPKFRSILILSLFLIPVYIFLHLNLPLSASPIRGEHWALLYRYVEDVPLSTKIRNIALFAFPGIERPQFLAFFVPYIPFFLFGINFTGHVFFSYCLHVIAGLLIVLILKHRGVALSNQFLAFSAFILSFVCSDVVNWAFFSYIQSNTILVLTSLYLLLKFEKTQNITFFYLQSLCIFFACFLYEISFTIFFVQILFLIVFRRNVKLLVIILVNILVVFLAVLVVFNGLPNQADATKTLHIGIIYRSMIFSKNLLVAFLGFYPMSVKILNTVKLMNQIMPPFFNAINVPILFSAVILIPIVTFKLIKKTLSDSLLKRLLFLSIFILGAYIVGLCFARARPQSIFFRNTYFDGQFRYYYLPIALLCVMVFSVSLPKKLWGKILIMLAVGVLILGNSLNTYRMNNILQPYHQESLETLEYTKYVLMIEKTPLTPESFIKAYVFLWVNEKFPLKRPFTSQFIYNAANYWITTQ
jgi:hypothetical protein